MEDINDHSPKFIDAPYKVAVDELTPVGKYYFFISFNNYSTEQVKLKKEVC